ncbi:hypothetical protein FAM22020_001948 [Propionibacterium freudenreichii]|uniref:hypothetical protein n=1 Tax=Propionibacterium freudenreichii TaxID=1744 RepID=UPI001107C4D5|nr:hypothetical protein [Propionibacterium freudenreichii]MCT2979352.1 hypothetical protein [Propionibacterium freudenreichii]MCT2985184.1 hypothetical protein [Propionibacterium freudenreichii]MDK9339749.1 hypothetical protein [Propionibacterium freudenreichii]MDK9352060.1 hypothetical protein [Propionibacterium freudenreichii]MDK9354257.1 hypothetical protein [Propionibacterium freudenreichii]
MQDASRLVRKYHLGSATSIDEAVSSVADSLGGRIIIHEENTDVGITGAVFANEATGNVHILWFTKGVLGAQHRAHVIAHELGHIIAAHEAGRPLGSQLRCGDTILERMSTHPDELAAEQFATTLCLRIRDNASSPTDRVLGLSDGR